MEKMGHTQYMKNKWKEISFKESRATTRMGYLPIGGGGLNASYTTVDAVANLCTTDRLELKGSMVDATVQGVS